MSFPYSWRALVPAADRRIADMASAHSDTQAALHLSKECMKEQYEQGKKKAHKFNVSNFVGLSSKNIKIH